MAKGVNFSIEGIDSLKARLERAPDRIRSEVARELRAGCENVVRNAIRDAPVDEGELRRSISFNQLGEMQFEIVAGVEYAAFIEFGTKSKVQIPGYLADVAAQYKRTGGSFKELLIAIVRWVHRKGISGTYSVKTKKRTGSKVNQLAEDYSIAYAIALSIAKKGISAHPFFFGNFKNEEPNIIRRVDKVLAQTFD